MFSRIKYLLPFALAGIVGLSSAGSLFAQIRSTTGGGATGGGATGGSPGGNTTGSTTSNSLGSFGLSQGNFALGGSNTGGSTSQFGNATGSSSGRGSGSGASPGSTTFMGPYFGDPLAVGLPSTNVNGTTTTKTFGQPLYTITNTTGNNTGNRGGSNFGNTGTGNINRGNTAAGTASTFNPNGAFRANAPAYTTRVAFATAPAPLMSDVRTELVRTIAESPELPSRGGISVRLDGGTVVLQGNVTNGEERRVVESLVRLTPGVREIRNELVALRPGDD